MDGKQADRRTSGQADGGRVVKQIGGRADAVCPKTACLFTVRRLPACRPPSDDGEDAASASVCPNGRPSYGCFLGADVPIHQPCLKEITKICFSQFRQ